MPTIITYRLRDGVIGYRAGDVLHDTDSDTWSLAVADGRGVTLQPLQAERTTGQTCVGDWRLTPLDVGCDLRAGDGPPVPAPPDTVTSAGLAIGAETYRVEAPRPLLIAVARAAGYAVV